ncbi:MAG: hypothetical protein ACR2LG_13670 [Actinomycetota bacterium]|nr:hypothetical protein [Actinomycetota bacterium]
MRGPGRRRHLHVTSVQGQPTETERTALEAALERLAGSERASRASSVWLRAARSQGRRLGMFDYRDRFTRDDAWRLSTRFPFGGREYPGRVGRGDTK